MGGLWHVDTPEQMLHVGLQAIARQARELDQMVSIPNCLWILGKSGAVRLLASSSQHVDVLSCSEKCHE